MLGEEDLEKARDRCAYAWEVFFRSGSLRPIDDAIKSILVSADDVPKLLAHIEAQDARAKNQDAIIQQLRERLDRAKRGWDEV